VHAAAKNFLFANPFDHLSEPPLRNRKLGEIGRHPDRFWQGLRDLPFVSTWKVVNDSLFLVLSFGLGLAWFITLVTLLAVGFGTILAWVGIPILAATFALSIWGAQLERSRIRVFLGVDIPSPYRYLPESGTPWRRAWHLLKNRQLWRDITYLLLLLPLGCLGLVVVWLPIPFLAAPFVIVLGSDPSVVFWEINNLFESLVSFLVGAVVIVPASMLVNIVANLNGEMGSRFLAPTTEEVLTERVEELTESRSAIMRAMHLERRRIERDLHDGAQQRLVSLAMELGLAREKMGTDIEAARKLLDESHEDAKLVLAELRDLVRGIHPAVLTDRGLDAAISAIAGRSPIPVGVDINLTARQPDEVEGTAYFVVVEALTNVAKHSGASAANVMIRRDKGWLRITIADNGRGGADPTKGSGLRGLGDRIAALDGKLSLYSPPGKGTTLTVEIPCA
jgi:signal transduction histidine kinase